MLPKTPLIIGLIGALLSVILGAFGAHAIKSKVTSDMLAIWQTGVHYQFFHSLALILHSYWLSNKNLDHITVTVFFTLGLLVFSGSLYTLVLSGQKFWGAITPIGGLSFIIAWLIWLIQVIRS